MQRTRKEELLGLLSAAGGGAFTGFLDAKFPDKQFLKLPVGAWVSGVAALGAVAGAGTKHGTLAGYVGDGAKGGIGFETGIAVVNAVLGAKDQPQAQQQQPGSVQGLREHRVVSQADLNQTFLKVQSQARRAA